MTVIAESLCSDESAFASESGGCRAFVSRVAWPAGTVSAGEGLLVWSSCFRLSRISEHLQRVSTFAHASCLSLFIHDEQRSKHWSWANANDAKANNATSGKDFILSPFVEFSTAEPALFKYCDSHKKGVESQVPLTAEVTTK